MTREEQRKEALSRIEQLTEKFNLNSNMLDYFKKEKIYALDYVQDDSQIKDRKELISNIITKRIFEDNFEIYYYFITNMFIENYTLEVLNIFYVSPTEEDWEIERLSNNNEMFILTYVLSNPEYPEFGFVQVDSIKGNLVRKS